MYRFFKIILRKAEKSPLQRSMLLLDFIEKFENDNLAVEIERVKLRTPEEIREYNDMRKFVLRGALAIFSQTIRNNLHVHVAFFNILGDENCEFLHEGHRRYPITKAEAQEDLLLKIIEGGNLSSFEYLIACNYSLEKIAVETLLSKAIKSSRVSMFRRIYDYLLRFHEEAACKSTLKTIIQQLEDKPEISFLYTKTMNAAKNKLTV
jgi:hypothetical protein